MKKNNRSRIKIVALRKATAKDLIFYFRLKNEEGVRRSSFDDSYVRLSEHRDWFQNKLRDINTVLFVIKVNRRLAGQVRFDIKKNIAEVDIALMPKYRGQGIGSKSLKKASRFLFKTYKNIVTLYARVKINNVTSKKSFLNAGFSLDEKIHSNQNGYFYIYLKRWE